MIAAFAPAATMADTAKNRTGGNLSANPKLALIKVPMTNPTETMLLISEAAASSNP